MVKKFSLFFVGFALALSIASCALPWQTGTETATTTEVTTSEVTENEAPTAVETMTETLVPTETATEAPTFTATPSLPVFTSPVIFSFSMFTPLRGWALTQDDDYLLVTLDGGQTWLDATPPGLHPLPPDAYSLNISAFFLDENTAWLTPGMSGMIYRTQNGGVTWTSNTIPFDNARYFFLDANNGYALVSLGAGAGSHYVAIHRTTDSGSTWTEVFSHEPGESKSLPESGTKNGITYLDMNHAWIGGTYPMEDYFYLHYSEDGGATWSREMDISLPGTYTGSWLDVWQPFFINSTTGYLPVKALAPDGNNYLLIYRSDDAGQTWDFRNSVEDGRDIDFNSVDEGWVASGNGLFHTNDGGLNWSAITGAGMPAGEFFLKVDFVDSQNGWVMTTPDDSTWTPRNIFRTTDAGSNWTQLLP